MVVVASLKAREHREVHHLSEQHADVEAWVLVLLAQDRRAPFLANDLGERPHRRREVQRNFSRAAIERKQEATAAANVAECLTNGLTIRVDHPPMHRAVYAWCRKDPDPRAGRSVSEARRFCHPLRRANDDAT